MKAVGGVCGQCLIRNLFFLAWQEEMYRGGAETATSISCDLCLLSSWRACWGHKSQHSYVWEAWQRLSPVALHHVSREMRGCRAGPGVKGQSWALSELISSYRRLNPLTLWCAMKKLCWLIWNSEERLFIVNVRLLKLEEREEQRGGEDTSEARICAWVMWAIKEACHSVSLLFIVENRSISAYCISTKCQINKQPSLQLISCYINKWIT